MTIPPTTRAAAVRAIGRNRTTPALTTATACSSALTGVGAAIARIVEAILNNQRALLTVCSRLEEAGGVKDVTLSLPHLIGGDGVLNTLQMPLTDKETKALTNGANVIKSAIRALKLTKS